MKKKKVILAKICPDATEHGIYYDKKFLSLALYYLKAYSLRDKAVKAGIEFEIKIFDIACDTEDALRQIFESSPDIVAYSAYLTEYEKTISLARNVSIVLPGVKQIIGGPSVRYPAQFLKDNPCFDAVVEGEGEEPFVHLMRSFVSGGEFDSAPSTTYRKDGKIVVSKDRPKRLELDDIPIIFTNEFMKETSGIAVCETSRGCMNSCKFCGLGVAGMRFHSMDRIEHDISMIFSRREIRRIFIGDSNFFTDTERSLQIIEIIRKHNRYKAQVEFYADFLAADEKLLAGCRKAFVHDSLRIPIQTFTRDALELAGRSWFDFATVRDTVQTVMKHFPSTWGEIIIGLPGDNYEGIKTSIRWCVENGLHNVRCHRLKSLPGSEYTKHPDKYGIVAGDTPPHPVYKSNSFSYAEMLRAEDLNRNYQIISPFIRTYDAVKLKEIGIDIVQEAELIDPTTPEWDGLFLIDGEGNIAETKAEAGLLFADFLGRRHKLTRRAVSFIKELFLYRHTSQSLYNYYKQNIIYNPDYIESDEMLSGLTPVVPQSCAIECNFDITAYLQGKVSIRKPAEAECSFVFLYSRKNNAAVPWAVNTIHSLDPVIHNVGKLLSKESQNDNMLQSAVGIATRLLADGYVYFRNNIKHEDGCAEKGNLPSDSDSTGNEIKPTRKRK